MSKYAITTGNENVVIIEVCDDYKVEVSPSSKELNLDYSILYKNEYVRTNHGAVCSFTSFLACLHRINRLKGES